MPDTGGNSKVMQEWGMIPLGLQLCFPFDSQAASFSLETEAEAARDGDRDGDRGRDRERSVR